jgi:cysteinyl-tRNA synthetase
LIELAESRQQARTKKDWDGADQIRLEIEDQGWIIRDSSDGYDLEKKSE